MQAVHVRQAGQRVSPEGRDRSRAGAADAPLDPRMRAYAQAQRHSARVRLFRRAIPIGAAIAIGAVLAIAIFDPFGRIGGLSLGPLSLSGTKITMENPRLTGYRGRDLRPYEVTAIAAMQDIRKPNVIELKDMRARLATDDSGGTARLESATGVFDTQKEQLELKQDIRVTTDTGHEARLLSASVDFKAGTVVSREPVTVKLTNGLVEADQLEISDNGKIIAFVGRVRTVLESASGDRQAGDAPPASREAAPARTSQAEPMSLRP
jgi:lipopolysaccharide export system protein LptC